MVLRIDVAVVPIGAGGLRYELVPGLSPSRDGLLGDEGHAVHAPRHVLAVPEDGVVEALDEAQEGDHDAPSVTRSSGPGTDAVAGSSLRLKPHIAIVAPGYSSCWMRCR